MKRSLCGNAVLAVIVLLFLLPLLMITWNAVVIQSDGGTQLTLTGFRTLLFDPALMRRFANSALITLPAMLLSLVLSASFSLLLSRAHAPVRKGLLAMLLVLFLLPFQCYMLPLFQLCKVIGLYDHRLVLILFESFSPMGPLLLYAFLRTIPEEQWEAAGLETNSQLRIFRSIILPQELPALGLLLIFTFVESWNLVEPAVILLQHEEIKPVSVSLNDFHGVSWAAAALYCLPSVTIACSFCILYRFRRK